jgi:hypothetical protein
MIRGPFGALTRYFVSVLLAPPLLTDLGADYLRRTIAGLVAMVLVAGVFLTRVFFRKYADLGGLTYPDAYLRALQSDTLLMIAVPCSLSAWPRLYLSLLFPTDRLSRADPFLAAYDHLRRQAHDSRAAGACRLAISAISASGFQSRRVAGARLIRARAVLRMPWPQSPARRMFSAVAAFQGLNLVVIPTWRRRPCAGAA